MDMSSFFNSAVAFAAENPLTSAMAVTATALSIVSLYFVFSKTRSPSSKAQISIQPDGVDVKTSEVITILLDKSFIKGVVRDHINSATKPRFTFSEFVAYAVPGIIALCFTAVLLYKLVADPKGTIHPTISQAFMVIVSFYFGTFAANKSSRT